MLVCERRVVVVMFFAAARWNPGRLGLVLLKLIASWLVPTGPAVTVAIDDTLLRRALIAAGFRREVPAKPTPEQIREVLLAWHNVAT